MSVVSSTHDLVPFVAGSSKPMQDQRLARVICKQTEKMKKAGIKALPSVCVSVPELTASDVRPHLDSLMPYVVALVQGAQDGIIRTMYETSKGQTTTVNDADITVSRCIAYLAAQSAGERLSKDSIVAWWSSSDLPAALTVIIAEKNKFDLSTPEQDSAVARAVTAHRDILCLLTGKEVSLGVQQERTISRMIQMAEELEPDSVVVQKMRAKFTELTAKPSIESELGFVD